MKLLTSTGIGKHTHRKKRESMQKRTVYTEHNLTEMGSKRDSYNQDLFSPLFSFLLKKKKKKQAAKGIWDAGKDERERRIETPYKMDRCGVGEALFVG